AAVTEHSIFFFQAEAGIRDFHVTGVQTCLFRSIDYIFDERARELYTEEPRHSEMVRVSYILATLNREGYSLATFSQKNWYHDRVMRLNFHCHEPKFQWFGHTATIEPHHVLWAIPQSVITANTLGTINQNIGYDGAENNVPPIDFIE